MYNNHKNQSNTQIPMEPMVCPICRGSGCLYEANNGSVVTLNNEDVKLNASKVICKTCDGKGYKLIYTQFPPTFGTK